MTLHHPLAAAAAGKQPGYSRQQPVACGHWPSDWSAAQAAAASVDYSELLASPWGPLWVAADPQQAECSLWRGAKAHEPSAHSQRLSPPGLSIRSRVYEYGGGALCLIPGGVALVREDDQQIWLLPLDAAGPRSEPYPITFRPHCRYGDLQHAPALDAVLAVEESREDGAVIHRIVAIGLHSGLRRVLAEGRDFYSNPRVSPDGSRLCWIEWDRPNQPWLATRLCVLDLHPHPNPLPQAGEGAEPRVLAGQYADESIQQARFREDGRLSWLSDKDGWWVPVDEQVAGIPPLPNPSPARGEGLASSAVGHLAAGQDGSTDRLSPSPLAGEGRGEGDGMPHADHAPAPWQLGTCSALPLEHGGWLLMRLSAGWSELIERRADGSERRLAREFSRFRQLAADADFFYCVAASPARLPAVLAICRATGELQMLDGGAQPLPAFSLSVPHSLHCAMGIAGTADGHNLQAFIYPPRNAGCQPLAGEKPPLLIFIHGGPTSACYPVFDPRIQFWTQRGFAVADLNHRGSTGFGRASRLSLAGRWGEIEVADVAALVAELAGHGEIDPDRVFIRGSSAGGFSVLNALLQLDLFRAATSLYGISDPLSLRHATHKFEADYLDWLIGDPARHAERYRARAALHNADQLNTPLLLLQGALDAVVVPEQTLALASALRKRQVPVQCHLYPDERHGFRKASNLSDALQREWRFYQKYL